MRRVAVAFAGQEELAARAAAGQGEGQPGQDHAAEVPQPVGVGHGLAVEAGLELPQDQVGDERRHQQGQRRR